MGDRKLDRLFQRYCDKSDVSALGELFDRASPELMRVSRHLCRDASEAEDVVQATFLTALTKSDSYDPKRRVLPWLLGIMALHAREARRKSGRTPDPERIHDRKVPEPIDAASEAEFQADVNLAVRKLPDTYRGVIFAHLAEGKGPREVAEQFGLTPVAARVRLHRGLKMLRQTLPPGFAIAAAAIATPSRGLAAVRAEVMEAGRQALASGPAGSAAVGAAGAAATSLKFKLLALTVGSAIVIPTTIVMTGALDSGGRGTPGNEVKSALVRELDSPAPDRAIELTRPTISDPPWQVGDDAEGRVRRSSQEESALELRSLSGRVVDADSGAALAGARIQFWPSDTYTSAPAFAQVLTDKDGRFEAKAVPARSAMLISLAGRPCLRRFLAQPVLPADSDEAIAEDLGDLALAQGNMPVGTVVTFDQEPVENASLLAAAPFLDWYGQPGVLQEIGHTGEAGEWMLDAPLAFSATRYANVSSLAAGDCSYLVVATGARGIGLEEVLVREEALSSSSNNSAAPADSTTNEQARIRFAESRPLRVHVIDSSGASVPEARLWIEPLALRPFFIQEPHDAAPGLHPLLARHLKARSSAEGMAEFEFLPFSEQPRSPWAEMTLFAMAQGGSMTSHTLSIRERAAGEISIVLRGSARLVLRGEVLSNDGRAIPSASVRVGEDQETETDESGLFQLSLDPSSTNADGLVLEISATGYDSQRNFIGGGAFDSSVAIVLRASNGPALQGPLRGRVFSADGTALAGIEVLLDSNHASRRAWTEVDGFFEVERTGSAEHRLRVLPRKELNAWADPILVGSAEEHIDVHLQQVEVQSTQLIAQVLHSRSMQAFDPDRAALLSLSTGAPAPVELMLGVGHVGAKMLPVGRWRLWVGRVGEGIGTVDFEVPHGRTRVETQVLIRGPGALEGQVRLQPESEPLAALQLRRLGEAVPSELGAEGWAGYSSKLEVELDADGNYNAQALIPGSYELLAGPQGSRGRQLIEIESGQRARVNWSTRRVSQLSIAFSELPQEGGVRLLATHENGDEFASPYTSVATLRSAALSQEEGLEAEGVLRIELPRGAIRWSLSFPQNDFEGSEARWHEALQGDVVLEAGEPLTVTPLD